MGLSSLPLLSPRSPLLCARGASRVGEYAYYAIIFTGTLREQLRYFWLASLVRRVYLTVLFALGAPWLLAWWGLRRYAGCFRYYVLQNRTFEMDFRDVLARVRPAGALHVGASVAQEAGAYAAAGVRRVVWVEAQPALEAPLRAAVAAADASRWASDTPAAPGEGPEVLIAAVSDSSGERVRLTITNNSISSSLLPLGAGHLTYLPFIRAVEASDGASSSCLHVEVRTVTMADLLAQRGVDTRALDFLYLDTQGSELAVLRGCDEALLRQMRAIMTEVSTEEHYVGGCMLSELDAFLKARGFERTVTHLPPLGHGNALYERSSGATAAAADKKAQ
jgi:FkbM family methyltransferase